uniref:Uncharacterized protein n=1 Tax=Pectinophora gossypiella TaxID=13191 RepID=A0A1E1WF28_PECGO
MTNIYLSDATYVNNIGLKGLQELFTDFDSWVLKFTAMDRSLSDSGVMNIQSIISRKLKRQCENEENIKQIEIPLEDLYVQGFMEIRRKNKFSPREKHNLYKNYDDFFVDYVIFRLTSDNKCLQYIKSKL